MTESRAQWKQQAEKLLTSLRDIIGAGITLDESGEITEVNILADGNRPPKQIVRDVRSALRAEYQVDVDYRCISVAQKSGDETGPSIPRVLTLSPSVVQEEPLNVRMRLRQVTVTTSHRSCSVRVELGLDKSEVAGEAVGSPARHNIPRLVAEATLQAVERLLDDRYHLSLSAVEIRPFAGEEIVLVGVRFMQEDGDKTLTGTCPVSHDTQQSIVYATLDSLNRILGRLEYREPIEFELRPSTVS